LPGLITGNWFDFFLLICLFFVWLIMTKKNRFSMECGKFLLFSSNRWSLASDHISNNQLWSLGSRIHNCSYLQRDQWSTKLYIYF
jgi:hypothetical protein